MLSWDSNPCGAIHARMEGRTSSVGGVSNANGTVRGYLFGDVVYIGMIEQEAMQSVQEAFDALPFGVIRALKDA